MSMNRRSFLVGLTGMGALLVLGAKPSQKPHPHPTPTPTAVPTPTPTSTPTLVPTPTPVPTSPPPTGLLFGTLATDSNRASQEFTAGLRTAGHEAYWDRVEGSDGVWNTTELNLKKTELARFIAAGIKPTLDTGIHYPPSYVYGLGRYTNQFGKVGGHPDMTWSQPVRDKVTRYVTKLNEYIPLSSYESIRIGGGGDVETLFPNHNADGINSNGYWAYSAAAQTTCPFPGLKPGTVSSNWAEWYSWYIDALVSEVVWKINLYKSLGFTGTFQVCMPGSGARPSVMNDGIANNLTRYGDVLARGAAWAEVVKRLAGMPNVIAYCSSAAEYANADYTQPGDELKSVTDTSLNSWSSMRWMTFLSKKYSLGSGGENPGYGDTTNYGPTMANVLCHQAKVGGWKYCYWAHDHNLYDGVGGITLTQYSDSIQNA